MPSSYQELIDFNTDFVYICDHKTRFTDDFDKEQITAKCLEGNTWELPTGGWGQCSDSKCLDVSSVGRRTVPLCTSMFMTIKHWLWLKPADETLQSFFPTLASTCSGVPRDAPQDGTVYVAHSGARYGPTCATISQPNDCPVLDVTYSESLGTRAVPGFHLTVTAPSDLSIGEIYFRFQFTALVTDVTVRQTCRDLGLFVQPSCFSLPMKRTTSE